MKVAVDGRIFTLPPTGIYQYTFHLLAAMAARGGHTFKLFLPSAPHKDVTFPEGVEWVCRDQRSGRVAQMWWHQVFLPRQVMEWQSDLFWSPHHFIPTFGLGCLPVVSTIHDLVWANCPDDMHFTRRVLERMLMGVTAQKATRLISVSNSTAQEMMRYFPDTRPRIQVIYPGVVPLPECECPDLTRFGITKPFVLAVGARQPRKNLPRLIRSFLKLPPDLRQSHQLVITGPRAWGDTLQRAGQRQDEVIATGYVDTQTLAALYRAATVFAFVSLVEGFGFPLLEAMQKETPILASNTYSLPEVAQEAALYVDPTSETEITAGLEVLLRDKAKQSRLVSAGTKRLREFSWNQAAARTLDLFAQAISG